MPQLRMWWMRKTLFIPPPHCTLHPVRYLRRSCYPPKCQYPILLPGSKRCVKCLMESPQVRNKRPPPCSTLNPRSCFRHLVGARSHRPLPRWPKLGEQRNPSRSDRLAQTARMEPMEMSPYQTLHHPVHPHQRQASGLLPRPIPELHHSLEHFSTVVCQCQGNSTTGFSSRRLNCYPEIN